MATSCKSYYKSAASRLIGLVVTIFSPSSNLYLTLEGGDNSYAVSLIKQGKSKLLPHEFYRAFHAESRFAIIDGGDGLVALYNNVSQHYLSFNGSKVEAIHKDAFSKEMSNLHDNKMSIFDPVQFGDSIEPNLVAFRNRQDCRSISVKEGRATVIRSDKIDWNSSGLVLVPYLQPAQEIALWSPSSKCYLGMESSTFELNTYCPASGLAELEFWRDDLRFQVVDSFVPGHIALFSDVHRRFLYFGRHVSGFNDNSYFNGTNYESDGEFAKNEKMAIITFQAGEVAFHNFHNNAFLTIQDGEPGSANADVTETHTHQRFIIVAHPFMRLPPQFVIEKALGVGRTAKVFVARNVLDGINYAVKYIKDDDDLDWERELTVLKKLPVHTNIMRYYSSIKFQDRLFIVTEYIDGAQLQHVLPHPSRNPYNETRTLILAYQIADALQTLHSIPIIHRDLHAANVLIKVVPGSDRGPTTAGPQLDDSFGGVKVIDFGLSSILSDHNATIVKAGHEPSRHYSPERALGKPFNEKDDVWAMAALFADMVLGWLSRLEGCGLRCNSLSLHPEVVDSMLIELKRASPAFGEIVSSVLTHRDPLTRPRAADVFDHIKCFMKKTALAKCQRSRET